MNVRVCMGKTCARTGKYICERLRVEQKKMPHLTFEQMTCTDQCEKGANVEINGRIHHRMNPSLVAKKIKS